MAMNMAVKVAGTPIAHLNIRGITRKVDKLKIHIVVKHHLKILRISEIFLNPNLNSKLLYIPNFNIILKDKFGEQGGGVLTYIIQHFNIQFFLTLITFFPNLELSKQTNHHQNHSSYV